MNFPPFGGHFPGSISTIQQFAAKFGHENPTNGIYPGQNCVPNRYLPTTNQITQQSTLNQHHQIQKYQQNTSQQYSVNQGIYSNDKRQNYGDNNDLQQLCNSLLQNGQNNDHKNQHQVNSVSEKVKEESHLQNHQIHSQTNQNFPPWQSSITGTSVADYLTHLPTTTLPLSIHHFLKYSAENIKKEQGFSQGQNLEHLEIKGEIINIPPVTTTQISTNVTPKKKKKKKSNKEKKPRPKPGEIRLTTALDGSTLYCCPECHMAYPEKELLEQHLVGHTMERKFVCDICGAGLKRKDHLTRHKQSHNPERPFVCTVCMKAFKRKEQLTLHYVIHSGEKRHVCNECGKGFYRKDHLRKHTRSHITRRVKAELSQQGNNQQPLHSMIAGTSNSQVLMS